MRVSTQLGGLQCRVLQEGEAAPRALAVICHGFGAPGDDLVPLYDELLSFAPTLAGVRFVFPEAPLPLPGMGAARAWWMIDFEKIQALNDGDLEVLQEFRKQEPAGMAKSRAMLLKAVDELTTQTGLPASKVLLGGFSQGAMLTTDVALRLTERPLALAILSGTLLVEDVWRAKAAARGGLPIFQSHGRQDPILRFDAAERLRDLLTEAGSPPDWVPFDGGHAIPLIVLRKLSQFLQKNLT